MKKITLLALAIMAFQFNFAQDTCATAISISAGTTSVGSIDGTADNTCGWQTPATAGEWYSYTPTANYTVTISSNLLANDGIINSDDTRVSIYTGSCGALQCLTGNDDFDFDNGIYLSELTFSATSGTTYYILWDDRWSASGFDFTLTEELCTATAAPQAVTTPTPADGATDVAIAGGDGVVFSWLESTAGVTADSYTISIGATPTGDDIGSLADVSSGTLITFGATSGTTYYWKIDAVNCFGETSSDVWSFTTAICTELAIPTSAASNPTPANGASGVAIQAPDGGVVFEWTAPDVEGESYNFNIGISNPPTQTIVGVESGDSITGFAVNTTYYWSIDVVNCFGQTTTTNVWSFTTDDVLSIEDNELETPLSVHPNPTSGILNIKSTQNIDSINVFNLLGQNVASFSKNAIIDSSIDLSDLSNGLYLVKITAGENTETLRVTKE
ncbi:T9SS type A sorting domain-containing protein [Winogradskyella sediminis]|uniref:Por secretion system C-terminal sorting domain-containing protein n=1 Tax=Winogradskyella sediminis TaxID=1382466 RepID=A0A1H1U0Y8_9FLAO|nr:T9SS type A sorting domain-containing protein [Winogradskyella sediminis]SDS66053.1 Por secretion system C-terminal sorting domain-containing protein [Winogradskyella sediminis]